MGWRRLGRAKAEDSQDQREQAGQDHSRKSHSLDHLSAISSASVERGSKWLKGKLIPSAIETIYSSRRKPGPNHSYSTLCKHLLLT